MNKKRALYVKACVIQNGVTDVQGDTLYREDIKRIFTSYNNNNSFEVNHDEIPIEGVSLLENYISSNDEQIGGTIVPSGSWLIVMKVTCPTIQSQILSGVYGGVSLSNRVKSECNCQLTGTIRYKDLSSAECVIPVYISLVDEGANGVGLEVFDYDSYILKSKDCMSDNMNLIDKLKNLIQEAEAEIETTESEAPVIDKEASDKEPKEEEQSSEEEPVKDSSEKEDDVDKSEIKKGCEKSEEEDNTEIKKEASEEVSEKNEEKSEEVSIEDLLKRVDELEKKFEDLTKEPESDEEKDSKKGDNKEPVIAKSAKVVITEKKESSNNFYSLTGRDPITGMKIK